MPVTRLRHREFAPLEPGQRTQLEVTIAMIERIFSETCDILTISDTDTPTRGKR